jgi:hypothetical protein
MTKFLVTALCLYIVFLGIYSYPVIKALYRNAFLTAEASPKVMDWSVRKLDSETWAIGLKYKFAAAGQSYENEEIFQGETFKNPYKAQDSLQVLKEKTWTVWYMPKHPSFSTVERYFPLKRTVYAAILTFLFVWGLYIARIFIKTHTDAKF